MYNGVQNLGLFPIDMDVTQLIFHHIPLKRTVCEGQIISMSLIDAFFMWSLILAKTVPDLTEIMVDHQRVLSLRLHILLDRKHVSSVSRNSSHLIQHTRKRIFKMFWLLYVNDYQYANSKPKISSFSSKKNLCCIACSIPGF